ncbi:MAG: hypothetical protein EXS31_07860 [Pedosphaera sp.]|nr:hypothetical protein [Pedosphaera sp.]
MITNRILGVILLVIGIPLIPVQVVSTFVLGLAVTLTFDLLLIPISIVWVLLYFPMLALSWVGNKVPGLREVLGFIFIPWVVLAHTFIQLMPSMGEIESRASKLMLCASWPFTWEFSLFLSHKLELKSADPAAIGLNYVVERMSSNVNLYQRVLRRVASGEQFDE